MDGFASQRYVQISGQQLPKLSLMKLLKIFTFEEKSQLISAVCLHFFKKVINSHLFLLYTENYIIVCINFMIVYIFVLYHKSADYSYNSKM